MNLMNFIEHNFDKLLLTMLFLVMVAVVLHTSHDTVDAAAIHWAREQANLFVGALVGLITGMSLRNKNNKPEEPKEGKKE